MDLLEAFARQSLEDVKELLILDPNGINAVDENGIPYAFLGARDGGFAIVKYIVEYSRASMNLRDLKQRNILHYAVESGVLDSVKYLVERVGMNPCDGDVDLVTSFDLAKSREDAHPEILAYLEDYVGFTYEDSYHNPIRSGMFPDPSIIRVGNDYYMVNSSFIFFPCIPISHSVDLIHWKIIGYAVTNPDYVDLDSLEGGRGFWAADISYHEGKFAITATYRLNDTGRVFRRQMIVTSDRPEGPYSAPSWIEEDGIDPSIFWDDDGRVYMLLNRGARILELSRDLTKQISPATLLFYGDQKRAPEGPHLLKKDGYYYLFLAEGGTGEGHRVTVQRSKELMGLYEPCPYNPILRQWDDAQTITHSGHGMPVDTPDGRWYMAYLAARPVDGKYTLMGRETCLDPMTWTADGWPIVNGLHGPSVIQKAPYSVSEQMRLNGITGQDPHMLQEIAQKNLDDALAWMTPRAPRPGTIERLNDDITIKGYEEDLHQVLCRSVYVRRQSDLDFKVQVKVSLDQLVEGGSAGLTCYYDENTYLTFGCFVEQGKTYLGIQEQIGEDKKTSFWEAKRIQEKEDVSLAIETHGFVRDFYLMEGEQKRLLHRLENVYYLCDEGIKMGKRFTGAMVGLYAHRMIAHFHGWNYEGLQH
ncbi:MAG: family 43 glycosylhydrolase [Lachnospiraceae bacterium]|nr:family 43 glycosylhydrolase [Lachnospiraceae bacterium]